MEDRAVRQAEVSQSQNPELGANGPARAVGLQDTERAERSAERWRARRRAGWYRPRVSPESRPSRWVFFVVTGACLLLGLVDAVTGLRDSARRAAGWLAVLFPCGANQAAGTAGIAGVTC